MSIVALIALIMVATVVVQLIGGGRGRHMLSWAASLAAILLVVGLGITMLRFTWSSREQYVPGEQIATMVAERTAHGEVAPDMSGYGVSTPTHTEAVRLKGGALLLMILLPLLAFSAVRRCRRSGGSALIPALGAAALLFLFFGGWVTVRSSRTTHSPTFEHRVQAPMPPVVQSRQVNVVPQIPTAPEAPMDELIDQFDHPRIVLDGHSHETAPPTADGNPNDFVNVAHDAHLSDEQRAAQAAAISAAIEASKLAGAKIQEITSFMSATAAEASALGNESTSATDAAATAHGVELSPATVTEVAPQPKPDWVVTPPKLAGPVQRPIVQVGPYSTRSECEEKLRDETRQVIQRRLYDLACEWSGREVYAPPLEKMGLGNSFIDRVVIERYFETKEFEIGPMETGWALLEFNQSDDRRLLEAWQSYARRDGIAITAVGSALVLGALGLIFGLIKVDTWTRGYYTKRLFLGVPAAIIAFVMLIAAMS